MTVAESSDREAFNGMRSSKPYGRTAAFVNDVYAQRGEKHVHAWFSGATCDFTDCVIYMLGFSAEKMAPLHWKLLQKHQVRLERCDAVTQRVQRTIPEFQA